MHCKETCLILVSVIVQMLEVTAWLHVAAPAGVQLKIIDASFLILQLEICIDSKEKSVEESNNNKFYRRNPLWYHIP